MDAHDHLVLSIAYDPFDDTLDGTISDPDDAEFVEAGPGFWLFYDSTTRPGFAGFSLRAASSDDFKVRPAVVLGDRLWARCSELIRGHRHATLRCELSAREVAELAPVWAELRDEWSAERPAVESDSSIDWTSALSPLHD